MLVSSPFPTYHATWSRCPVSLAGVPLHPGLLDRQGSRSNCAYTSPAGGVYATPPSFDSLLFALDALGSEEKVFGLDFVKSRLLQEEQREIVKSESTKASHGPALVNRAPNRREMNCTNCSSFEHTALYCWEKDVNGRRPAPPNRFRAGNNTQTPSAFVSQQYHSTGEPNEDDYSCFLCNSSVIKSVPASTWLVDSGCSAHVTFDKSFFITYERMGAGSVEMGTKARATVAGRGKVELMPNVNGV